MRLKTCCQLDSILSAGVFMEVLSYSGDWFEIQLTDGVSWLCTVRIVEFNNRSKKKSIH